MIALEGIGDDEVCDVVRCDDLKVMFAIRIAWTRELIEQPGDWCKSCIMKTVVVSTNRN